MTQNEALADALRVIATFMEMVGKPGDCPPAVTSVVTEQVAIVRKSADAFAPRPSISTPIPLTPSDEMVEAALDVRYPDWRLDGQSEAHFSLMRKSLQAALNLMGGKK